MMRLRYRVLLHISKSRRCDFNQSSMANYQCLMPLRRFMPQQIDFLGESTSGNLRLVQRVKSEGIVNVLGLEQLDDIVTVPYSVLKISQQVCPVTSTPAL